jgi:hypothetical protein
LVDDTRAVCYTSSSILQTSETFLTIVVLACAGLMKVLVRKLSVSAGLFRLSLSPLDRT